MNNLYTIITSFLQHGDKSFYEISKESQESYLNSLGQASNDFERSHNQFLCQCLFVSKRKLFLLNLASVFILPIFILAAIIKRWFTKFNYSVDAILQKNNYYGVIPITLEKKYKLTQKVWYTGWSLGYQDFCLVINLFKSYLGSPYFVFKCSYKIALYSNMIKRYNPNAIVVFNEYSYTSSILTFLCEKHKIKHIDVMHGEKLYYIRDSFFRFSETYVWEPYYIKLFEKLKAPIDQFINEIPPFMSFIPSDHLIPNYAPDFTYYLAMFSEHEIKNIVDSVKFANGLGKKVMFRPHPRYSDLKLLRKYVPEDNIEYPDKINIMESLANTHCAIGVYTTVLNQAYHINKQIIIDDINFPHIYEKLQELEYSLISRSVDVLSKYQL